METNTAGHVPNSTLTYGDIKREPSALPVATVSALLARGFAHFLGNEQNSKLVGAIRSKVVEGTERKADTVSKDEIATYRADHADVVTALADQIMTSALKALDEGTIGYRASGGGFVRDPVEAEARKIARVEVTAAIKKIGGKVPKGEDTFTAGELTLTMDGWIDRRLQSAHADRIRAEAAKNVKAAQRKLAQAAEMDL